MNRFWSITVRVYQHRKMFARTLEAKLLIQGQGGLIVLLCIDRKARGLTCIQCLDEIADECRAYSPALRVRSDSESGEVSPERIPRAELVANHTGIIRG